MFCLLSNAKVAGVKGTFDRVITSSPNSDLLKQIPEVFLDSCLKAIQSEEEGRQELKKLAKQKSGGSSSDHINFDVHLRIQKLAF